MLMMRLVSSERALEVALALTQRPDGLTLSQLAGTLDLPTSTAQGAIEILVDDGLVHRDGPGRAPYRLRTDHPAAGALAVFAARAIGSDRAIAIVLRASPAVEFAGVDGSGYLYVARRFEEPSDGARLAEALGTILDRREPAISVLRLIRDDARGADAMLRRRVAAMRVIRGSIARSFPLRPRRRQGRPLGRLHPSLTRPSGRALRGLAERFGVQRIVAFGSAVRSDFRDDSDVDLLVEPAPGRSLDLDAHLGLTVALDRLFDRDVDLVNSIRARKPVARKALEEGVVLYG